MTYAEAAAYRITETDAELLLDLLADTVAKREAARVSDAEIRAELDTSTNTELGRRFGVSRRRVERVRKESA